MCFCLTIIQHQTKAVAGLVGLMLGVLDCSRNTPVSPPTDVLVPRRLRRWLCQWSRHWLQEALRKGCGMQPPVHLIKGDASCQVPPHPISMQTPTLGLLASLVPFHPRKSLLHCPRPSQQESSGAGAPPTEWSRSTTSGLILKPPTVFPASWRRSTSRQCTCLCMRTPLDSGRLRASMINFTPMSMRAQCSRKYATPAERRCVHPAKTAWQDIWCCSSFSLDWSRP